MTTDPNLDRRIVEEDLLLQRLIDYNNDVVFNDGSQDIQEES